MAIMRGTPKAKEEELSGRLAKVIYEKDDFLIGILGDGTGIKGTVKGSHLQIGGEYRFLGKWETHQTYGKQFAFSSFTREVPHNRMGVVRYLMDEAPGVGYVTSQHLWDKYKEKAVETLRSDWRQVVSDGVMSEQDAKKASEALSRKSKLEKTMIDLESLLSKRGFPKAVRFAAIEAWGADAPKVIQKNPYILLAERIRGCGFKRVDQMYLDMGGDPAWLERQTFAAWHFIASNRDGHTWHDLRGVARYLRETIGGTKAMPESAVSQACSMQMLTLWRNANIFDACTGWVAEYQKAHQEFLVAQQLRLLSSAKPVWPTEISGLSPHQAEQAKIALSTPVAILTGGPGTGKTYSAACIIKAILFASIGPTAACAPTGKAAVRLSQLLNQHGINTLRAKTIHSTLGVDASAGSGFSFMYRQGKPLPFKFIVVDEMSMTDTGLFCSLLLACGPDTHLLIIGDKYQLPPVGHGAPLRDILRAIPSHGELTQIVRNKGLIVRACHAIKDGKDFQTATTPKGDNNLVIYPTADAGSSVAKLRQLVKSVINNGRFDPVNDLQVICAVNKKSAVSRDVLNGILQGMLNPAGRKSDKHTYRVGDKIICLQNGVMAKALPKVGSLDEDGEIKVDSDLSENADDWKISKSEDKNESTCFVANGELGRVLAISDTHIVARFTPFDRIIRIPMYSKKKAEEDEGDEEESGRSDFDLGYAITTHKSQGSQAPVIISVIDDYAGAAFVCSREWHYTAISRAEKFCLLIGKKATLLRHCQRVAIQGRKTFLAKSISDNELFKHLETFYNGELDRRAKEIRNEVIGQATAVQGADIEPLPARDKSGDVRRSLPKDGKKVPKASIRRV